MARRPCIERAAKVMPGGCLGALLSELFRCIRMLLHPPEDAPCVMRGAPPRLAWHVVESKEITWSARCR